MAHMTLAEADKARDEDLYAAWAAGDLEAADRLVGRHLLPIRRFFDRRVEAAADAEDLTYRVFEICSRSLGDFARRSKFSTYLFGIAHNVLRDYIKRRRRDEEVAAFETTSEREFGPSPSTIMAQHEDEVLLLASLRSIPVMHQAILELSYFEGLTRAEIAELLDLPAGTVASRLRRGVELLGARFEHLSRPRRSFRHPQGTGQWKPRSARKTSFGRKSEPALISGRAPGHSVDAPNEALPGAER